MTDGEIRGTGFLTLNGQQRDREMMKPPAGFNRPGGVVEIQRYSRDVLDANDNLIEGLGCRPLLQSHTTENRLKAI